MTQVILTSVGTNTWTVPSDFGSVNTIEVIGAGGSGGNGVFNSAGGSGGGGGYGKISNISLTPGGSVSYTIATGGSSGDTYFNANSLALATVGSQAGQNGTTSSKGTGSTGKGTTTYKGGDGDYLYTAGNGGGGGGAAGPNGNGGNGSLSGNCPGGRGDNGFGGIGGTQSGGSGTNGANGTEYGSAGSGGGGGGCNYGGAFTAGSGGAYGAAGGAGGLACTGGSGSQGVIVINYTPAQFLTLTAVVGSFTLTGIDATFAKTVNISFATGYFVLTGLSATFKYNGAYTFGADTGYFVLTGEDVALSIGVNNKIFAGIFSLIVSPTQNDSAKGLVMEAQNSYGLTPAFNSSQNGLLISNEQYENYDSYYSAWSNSNMGGIDFNDTTLWSNYEPLIETDIIPLGSILDKRTLGQVMFKLDRPMVTGDFIRISARGSLTDAYTIVGTTSTNQLSENLPSNLSQLQWIQFLIQFKCASSGSSRIPFRELRIQMK